MDATGVGDAVMDILRQDAQLPVQPFQFNLKSKTELVETLKVALEKGKLKLMQDRNLLSELTAFSYEVREEYIKYGTQAEHDDYVMALALAVWAAKPHTTPSVFIFGGKI